MIKATPRDNRETGQGVKRQKIDSPDLADLAPVRDARAEADMDMDRPERPDPDHCGVRPGELCPGVPHPCPGGGFRPLYYLEGECMGLEGRWQWVFHSAARNNQCPNGWSKHEMGCYCGNEAVYEWTFIPRGRNELPPEKAACLRELSQLMSKTHDHRVYGLSELGPGDPLPARGEASCDERALTACSRDERAEHPRPDEPQGDRLPLVSIRSDLPAPLAGGEPELGTRTGPISGSMKGVEVVCSAIAKPVVRILSTDAESSGDSIGAVGPAPVPASKSITLVGGLNGTAATAPLKTGGAHTIAARVERAAQGRDSGGAMHV